MKYPLLGVVAGSLLLAATPGLADWVLDDIRERAEILPVPIEVAPGPPRREGPCHIVWNHRREFDKGGESLLDLVVAVRGGNEACLEGRRCEIDALVQHAVEERLEPLDVGGRDLRETPHRAGIGEHEAEHAALLLDAQGDAGVGRRGGTSSASSRRRSSGG